MHMLKERRSVLIHVKRRRWLGKYYGYGYSSSQKNKVEMMLHMKRLQELFVRHS